MIKLKNIFQKRKILKNIESNFETNPWWKKEDNFLYFLKKISSDSRLDSKDNQYIKNILDEYNENVKEQKTYFLNILNSVLVKWFSIENEETYNNFSIMLMRVKKISLPKYDEIFEKTWKNDFSLKKVSENKIWIFILDWTNFWKKIWEIDIKTWEIFLNLLNEKKSLDLSSFIDNLSDNNTFFPQYLDLETVDMYDFYKKSLDRWKIDTEFQAIKDVFLDKKINFLEERDDAMQVSWIFSKYEVLENSQKKFLKENFDFALKNWLEFNWEYGFSRFLEIYEKIYKNKISVDYNEIISKNKNLKNFVLFRYDNNFVIFDKKTKKYILSISLKTWKIFYKKEEKKFSFKNIWLAKEKYIWQNYLWVEKKEDFEDEKNDKKEEFKEKKLINKKEEKFENKDKKIEKIKIFTFDEIISRFEKINYSYKIFEKNTKWKKFSEDVVALQIALNALYNAKLEIDWDFWEKTYMKLMEFQRDNKILNDARVWIETRTKIIELLKKKKKSTNL